MASDELDGRMAYRRGDSDSVCPHFYNTGRTNARRVRWMSGYWGERVDQFLEKLEAKYKVTM